MRKAICCPLAGGARLSIAHDLLVELVRTPFKVLPSSFETPLLGLANAHVVIRGSRVVGEARVSPVQLAAVEKVDHATLARRLRRHCRREHGEHHQRQPQRHAPAHRAAHPALAHVCEGARHAIASSPGRRYCRARPCHVQSQFTLVCPASRQPPTFLSTNFWGPPGRHRQAADGGDRKDSDHGHGAAVIL